MFVKSGRRQQKTTPPTSAPLRDKNLWGIVKDFVYKIGDGEEDLILT